MYIIKDMAIYKSAWNILYCKTLTENNFCVDWKEKNNVKIINPIDEDGVLSSAMSVPYIK